MNRKHVGKNLASAALFIVLGVLAIGSTGGNGGGGGGTTKNVPTTGSERRINGNNWFGSVSEAEFDRLVQYAVQKDKDAFGKALAEGLLSGTCTAFQPGESVYIMDTAIFSGKVKVRRKGETVEYWTNIEAVKE